MLGNRELVWIIATATVGMYFIFNPSEITMVRYLVDLSLLILYEYSVKMFNFYDYYSFLK